MIGENCQKLSASSTAVQRSKKSVVLISVASLACLVTIVGCAFKSGSNLENGFGALGLDGEESVTELRQRSTDLADALSSLKKSHGKYCDRAVSFPSSRLFG